MARTCNDKWLAGVDGCPAGWIVALIAPDAGAVDIRIFQRFLDVLAVGASTIAIDIPIGLPERAGHGGRAAENAVRPLLGARQSSVFSVPSRAAIEAMTYREACAVALATSDPPRKVSKQLFMLVPKIREVDAVVRADKTAIGRVFEVHPELAYWRLNGGRALDEPKKVKGRPDERGLALRRRLLMGAGLPADAVNTSPPRGAGPDDLLDAIACAWVAGRIRAGLAEPFPNPPQRDAFGLPMAIWA
jgi:predicted RNase H-like nuclease